MALTEADIVKWAKAPLVSREVNRDSCVEEYEDFTARLERVRGSRWLLVEVKPKLPTSI